MRAFLLPLGATTCGARLSSSSRAADLRQRQHEEGRGGDDGFRFHSRVKCRAFMRLAGVLHKEPAEFIGPTVQRSNGPKVQPYNGDNATTFRLPPLYGGPPYR